MQLPLLAGGNGIFVFALGVWVSAVQTANLATIHVLSYHVSRFLCYFLPCEPLFMIFLHLGNKLSVNDSDL